MTVVPIVGVLLACALVGGEYFLCSLWKEADSRVVILTLLRSVQRPCVVVSRGVSLPAPWWGAVTIKHTAVGTQRLTRTIGKYRTMEMILTGMQVSAQEMAVHGLVNRIVLKGEHLNEALKLAREIAEHAPIAIRQAKQAVLAALATPLEEGLNVEHQNVAVVFNTEDMR